MWEDEYISRTKSKKVQQADVIEPDHVALLEHDALDTATSIAIN